MEDLTYFVSNFFMANIAITKYCNLHCPYCFAASMIAEEEKKNITIEDFQYILNWIGNASTDNRIGIIGGEPTLHPQFLDILKILNNYCEFYNKDSILFTNGIYLEPFLKYLSPKMGVLININTPDAMTKEQNQKLISTLNAIQSNNLFKTNTFTLGCNICPEILNYDFFWDIILKYSILQTRISVTAPNKESIYYLDKDKYYSLLKPIFLDFINNAYKNKIKFTLDCNHIPFCYFTEKELEKISLVIDNFQEFFCDTCSPVIDITSDFKATSCFGIYDSLIDCKNFNNFDELEEYFNRFNILKSLNNKQGKCKECKKFDLLQCQGGCLSFADTIIKNNF